MAMTREQKVAEARRLRSKGQTYPQIAEALGVAKSTVRRWLIPGEAERGRADARAWKARHREQMREYNRRYHDENRATCPECGHRYGKGSGRIDGEPASRLDLSQCSNCTHLRRERIVEWWAQGRKHSEIANELGWTVNHLGVELIRMREAGYLLPYRYRLPNPKHPEQVAA